MKKNIFILSFLLSFNVSAEIVTCTSSDPDLKIKIAPTFLNPNSGSFEYLQLKIEKKSSNFAERIYFKTLVKRKRVLNGFEYIGMPDASDVSLRIDSKTLIVKDIKADLLIKQNSASNRKFEALKCSVEGIPLPPFEDCPKPEELNLSLSKASRESQLDTVQDLLVCGADPSFKDEKGCSALLNLAYGECGHGLSTQWGYIAPRPGIPGKKLLETIAMLLSRGTAADEFEPTSQRTAVHFFAITGQTEAMKSLFDFEADVNSQDVYGNTPLIYAATTGDGFIVKTINEYNPKRGIKNLAGKTAYNIATEMNFRHLLPLLEDASQEVVIDGNKDGSCSPLSLHLKSGTVSLVLKATNKMFMLTIPSLDIELMAAAGQEDRATLNVSSGMFSFTCGIHGGQEYQGSIMAH